MTAPPTLNCAFGKTALEEDCSKRLVLSECLQAWQREAHQGTFDTGRYRCHYSAWGRGPALVLVPGMACDAQSFVMLTARLKAQFLCISYDLPAGGSDGAHLMTYRHPDLVSDLFALLDHVRVGECHVLGASLGSTVALAALHQQPGRFARAVLQGGFAHRRLAPAEVFCAAWARFLPGRLGQIPLMRRVLERSHRDPFRARGPEVWDFFVDGQCQLPIRALARRALILDRVDLRTQLPEIQQPVMLVCGDHDPLVNKACEKTLMEGLPKVVRAEIEECGHYPQLTHPEVMAEAIEQFLDGGMSTARKQDCAR